MPPSLSTGHIYPVGATVRVNCPDRPGRDRVARGHTAVILGQHDLGIGRTSRWYWVRMPFEHDQFKKASESRSLYPYLPADNRRCYTTIYENELQWIEDDDNTTVEA